MARMREDNEFDYPGVIQRVIDKADGPLAGARKAARWIDGIRCNVSVSVSAYNVV